jgi:hypothetical protein
MARERKGPAAVNLTPEILERGDFSHRLATRQMSEFADPCE